MIPNIEYHKSCDPMHILSFMILFACILVPFLKISAANDSINMLQSTSDGETLVSKGGKFEFGFFSPGNSHKRYLGIWYKNVPIQTVVWVANRVNPINDSSGILTLNTTGNLVLTQNSSVVWYTNNSHKQAQNPVAELLDSGNLVVRNEEETNPEAYLWQSFDYPSDTFLPGMKLGRNLRTGHEWKLTAWKSPDDPSPGDIYRVLELYNYPEFYIMKGTKKAYRFGPWSGLYFTGTSDFGNSTMYSIYYVSNKDEIYFTYSIANDSLIGRSVVNQTTTTMYRYIWVVGEQDWKMSISFPQEFCDTYSLCGAYGNCVSSTQPQACQCLKGFSPKSPQAWDSFDWTGGCVRNKPLSCKGKLADGFVKYEGLKVPDTTHTWLDESIGLEECRVKCLNNCSCMAFTNSDIKGEGSGCVMWFGDLMDIKQVYTRGQDLYIRMPASESEYVFRHKKNTATIAVATTAAICGFLLLSGYVIYCIRRNIAAKTYWMDKSDEKDDMDFPTFDFSSISNATNHFSESNKLGQGGFGTVYKGILPDGQEIAVKRLSQTSGQGFNEFKNEVTLIAKLQHRNLVTLLGCSIQQDEKLLIYEFMPHRSLDYFIFDSKRRTLLGWAKRFEIIGGIARGLLYLHQDSRLNIIHRDLKTGNVLLDKNLNPKISDFGMARTFGLDQDESRTNRIMGTYGYMAPEYAVHGSISVKSDVYSFGVIVIEIISGRKIKEFSDPHHHLNLLGHAWTVWIQKKPMELMDDLVDNSADPSEILRHINVGLLCVQQRPEDRPNMSSIVLMLNGEKLLPEPSQPGFYTGKDHPSMITSPKKIDAFSLNDLSNSVLEGR